MCATVAFKSQEKEMSRATEVLHVSQPTLSKQMTDLEDEIEKTIYTNKFWSQSLTDEGIFIAIKGLEYFRNG